MTAFDVLKFLAPLAYSLLEYWLGKTKTVKANSVVELALNLIKKKPQEKVSVMNTELKAFISMIFDLGSLTQMLIKDKGLSLEEEGPAMKIIMEAPSAFSGLNAAIAELKALTPAGEADLVAFLGTELGIVNPKTSKIILQTVSFILAGYNLEQAITQP